MPNPPPSSSTLQRLLKSLRLAFWQRRFLQGILRTVWLTLLVPTGVMMGYLFFDWRITWQSWLSVMLLVAALSLLWTIRPIALKTMVKRLEQQLGFQAQLITAFEASQTTAPHNQNQVVQRLFHQATEVTRRLRHRIRLLNMGLWLEIEALIAVVALFSALLMLDAFNPTLPNAEPVALPPAWQEPRADEVLPPDVQLYPPPFQQPPALSQQQIDRILEILADEFRDQAITRSIADALDQGDLPGAANELRGLADQLEELSTDSQRSLAESLQSAADQIGQGSVEFTAPLRDGSSALGSGLTPRASQALEDLAEMIDQVNEQRQASELADASGQGEAEGGGANEPDQPEAGQGEGGDQEQGGTEEESQGQGEPAEPTEEETEGDGGEAPQDGQEEEGGEANELNPTPEAPPEEPGQPGHGPVGEGDEPNEAPTEEERLAIEGQPLELEGGEDEFEREDRVLQPSELEAEAGDERTQDSPFARPIGASEELGPDTLTYPWEKRDVIRRYFAGDESPQ